PIAAAAVLAIASGAWLLRPRTTVGPAQDQQAQAPSSSPVPQAAQPQPVPQQLPPPAQPQSTDAVVAMTLTPGLVRSQGDVRTLQIPANATGVRFRLEHEASGYSRYRVVLKTVDGREIWRQAAITSTDLSSVTVTLPARSLSADDYVLTLSGGRPDSADRE